MEEKFRNKFKALFGDTVSVVSTTDHPYPSPPIRMLSTHSILYNMNQKGDGVLMVLWDTITPPDGSIYRSAFSLDTGLIASHDPDLFFYKPNILYPLQKPKKIDYEKLENSLSAILNVLTDVPRKMRMSFNDSLIKNFKKIRAIYEEIFSQNENSSDAYIQILSEFYKLFGVPELGSFVKEHTESLYSSKNLKEWIVWCIQETNDTDFGIENLIDKENVLQRRLFRSKDDKTVDYKKVGINNIADGIRNGDIVVSPEVFFWTLALARIKHFGNDRDFFNRLSKNSGYECVASLQLTEHNKDFHNLIEFNSSKSFSCEVQGDKYRVKSHSQTKKGSIATMPVVYCHLGKYSKNTIHNLVTGKMKSPLILKLGTPYQS